MRSLVADGKLNAYRHMGFWQSMDTIRDKEFLQAAYDNGAPWLKE